MPRPVRRRPPSRFTMQPKAFVTTDGETVDLKPPGRRKFHNVKVLADGHWWDSEKEARRYGILKKAERDGLIINLIWHRTYYVRWPTGPLFEQYCRARQLLFTYKPDFEYDLPDGRHIVEDVKATSRLETTAFRLKVKILRVMHKVLVQSVYNAMAPIG